MNRAMRRQNERIEDKFNRNLRIRLADELEASIKKEKDDAVQNAIKVTLQTCLGLTALILNNDHGFGPKRMNEYFARIFEQYECFRLGYISLDDIKMWCKEKNIKFEELFKEG